MSEARWGPSERVAGFERTLIRRVVDAAPTDAIHLGLGEPDLPTPRVIAAEGVRAIEEGRTRYTTTAGLPALRRAIADRYRPAPSVDEIVVTVGSQEAMYATLAAITDPGGVVVVPDPGYPAYATVARLLGLDVRTYPLDPSRRYRMRATDVLDRVDERTAAVVLCAPSNPTGAIPDVDEVERLARELDARAVPWVSDEIYDAFCYGRVCKSPREVVPTGGVVVSGVSKGACMTGWRLGWVVAPSEVAYRVNVVHQHLVTCAPSPAQYAAIAALGPAGVEARAGLHARFSARRDLVLEELGKIPSVSVDPPDGAFYVFARIEGCTDSMALAMDLVRNAGVVTVPGIAFGSGGEGALRLSYAASEASIVEGVRAIGAHLASGSR